MRPINERTHRNKTKNAVTENSKSLNKTIVEESNLRKDINNFFSKTPRKILENRDNLKLIFNDKTTNKSNKTDKIDGTDNEFNRFKRSKSFYKNEFIPKYNDFNCDNIREKINKQTFYAIGSEEMKVATKDLNSYKDLKSEKNKSNRNSIILNPKEQRLKTIYPDMSDNELKLLSKNSGKINENQNKNNNKSNITDSKNTKNKTLTLASKFNSLINRSNNTLIKCMDKEKSTIIKSTQNNTNHKKFEIDKKQNSAVIKYDIFGTLINNSSNTNNKSSLFKNLKREKSTIKNIKNDIKLEKENINNQNTSKLTGRINENFAYEISIDNNTIPSENELKRKLASSGIHAYKIELSKNDSIKNEINSSEKYIIYVRSASQVKNNNSEIKLKKIKDCLNTEEVRLLEFEKNGRAILDRNKSKSKIFGKE